MTERKIIAMLGEYLKGYAIEFGHNPNKVSLFRDKKRLVIDYVYLNRNFVVLLYMCYATTLMHECENNVCLADRKAIERLKKEGHTVDKHFFVDVLRILSDRNETRIQVLTEMQRELPYGKD